MADQDEHRAMQRRLTVLSVAGIVLFAALLSGAGALLFRPLGGLSPWAGDSRATYWLVGGGDGFPARPSDADPRRSLSRQTLGPTVGRQIALIFRIRRDLGERPALLAPIADGQPDLFVNGVRVREEGRSAPPYLALSGARAQLWPIPPELFRPGENRIDLVGGAAQGRSLRARLYIGPLERFEPVVTAIARFEILARPTLMLLGLAATGLALLVAAVRRTARPWIPLAAVAGAIGARALIAGPDSMAALGGVWRATDLALLAAALLCAAFAATGPGRTGRASEMGLVGLSAGTLLAAFVAASGLGWGLWTLGAEVVYGTGAAALMLTLAVASGLAAAQTLWRIAVQRVDLGRVIRRQQAQIRAAATALEQEMRRSAIFEERQRLARDMHDGIGGQLVSLLARVRTRRISLDQMEEELADGLSELRLLVDSLDAVGESLSGALASFRARIRPQAEAAGMTLTWTQPDDLDIEACDPRWILNLYRLLQEAVTNAVRHSGGRVLSIRVGLRAERGLTIIVEDDGAGFDPATVRRGKGLNNMEVRAAQLNAGLRWTAPASGIGTVLTIDLVAPIRPVMPLPIS